MKIMITGATGFLGQYLVAHFLQQGHTVIAISAQQTHFRDSACSAAQLIRYDGTFESISFLPAVDIVIHAATHFQSSHVPGKIDQLCDANIKFGAHLLEWMHFSKTQRLINISTYATSIDGKTDSPQNFYSATKQMFEALVLFYAECYQFSVVTLYLHDLYGLRDSRGKFIDLLLKAIKQEQTFCMSQGEQEIAYLYVTDAVLAIDVTLQLLLKEQTKPMQFLVRGAEIMQLKQLVPLVFQVTGKEVDVIFGHYPYRNREIMTVHQRYPLLPNWKPHVLLNEGIQKKWQELNGN